MSNEEVSYLDIVPFTSVTCRDITYHFDIPVSQLNLPEDSFTKTGEAQVKNGFLGFTNGLASNFSNQKVRDINWIFRIGENEITGTGEEKCARFKELYPYEQIGEMLFFPTIGVRLHKIFINIYTQERYEFARNARRFIVHPLQTVTCENKTYTLGASWEDTNIAAADIKSLKIDYPTGTTTALVKDTRLTFRHGGLVAVYTNYGSITELVLGDKSGDLTSMLPVLMQEYEHEVIREYPADTFNPAPATLCLFPTLGVLMSDRRELAAGTAEEVANMAREEQKKSKKYLLRPYKGYLSASGKNIDFGMTEAEVNRVDGLPKQMELDPIIMHWTVQTRDEGYKLHFPHGVNQNFADAPLATATFFARDESLFFVEDISLFDDKKLGKMKALYEYKDGKRGLGTLFPTLGLYTRGCGEKKNAAKGAEGKLAIAFCKDELPRYERMLAQD